MNIIYVRYIFTFNQIRKTKFQKNILFALFVLKMRTAYYLFILAFNDVLNLFSDQHEGLLWSLWNLIVLSSCLYLFIYFLDNLTSMLLMDMQLQWLFCYYCWIDIIPKLRLQFAFIEFYSVNWKSVQMDLRVC